MLRFILGVGVGIFLAQKYDFPNIEVSIEHVKTFLATYEKKK